jgi:hypothetical protein
MVPYVVVSGIAPQQRDCRHVVSGQVYAEGSSQTLRSATLPHCRMIIWIRSRRAYFRCSSGAVPAARLLLTGTSQTWRRRKVLPFFLARRSASHAALTAPRHDQRGLIFGPRESGFRGYKSGCRSGAGYPTTATQKSAAHVIPSGA